MRQLTSGLTRLSWVYALSLLVSLWSPYSLSLFFWFRCRSLLHFERFYACRAGVRLRNTTCFGGVVLTVLVTVLVVVMTISICDHYLLLYVPFERTCETIHKFKLPLRELIRSFLSEVCIMNACTIIRVKRWIELR